MQHAFENKLSLSIQPILVWDTIDDPERIAVIEYPSIANAVITLGGTRSGISQYLLRNNNNLYLNKYVIKYSIDHTPWLNLKDIRNNSMSTIVSAKNIHTGKIYTEYMIKTLANVLKINSSTVHNTLKKEIPCYKNTWLFAYDKDNINWTELEQKYRDANPNVVLHNTVTNTRYIYSCIKDLAYINKLPVYSLSWYLKNKRYQYKHYLIYYLNDSSEKLLKLTSSLISKTETVESIETLLRA